MTASAWNPNPATVSQANASGLVKQELLIAGDGQRDFALATFAYVVGTGSLKVHKNGKTLARNVDYLEVDSTRFLLNDKCDIGDEILAEGFVGITGTVATDAVLRADLGASGGSTLVKWLRTIAGAVVRTVTAKLSETVSPEDFGATGDGVADDTAAVQATINYWQANRNVDIRLVNKYLIYGTLTVANLETDAKETRLKFTGGGTLIKNNAGFMFDRPVGQALQTGHIYFFGTRFEGAMLNGLTFIINGDNVIRVHFIGCMGNGINIAKANGYIQTIYCSAGTTWRKWNGYLFDCGYLFDLSWNGVAEAGDAFLITRTVAADPACNSLKVSGCIEGLTGVSGPMISAGACWASEISNLYCEGNAGGDIDFSNGSAFHKGLTIRSCGFQPTAAQLANPNYYSVVTGKAAQNGLTLIGNASTGNLFDVTNGNQSAVVDMGNYVPNGKNKFSPTSVRMFSFDGLKLRASVIPGLGAHLDAYSGAFGFEETAGTVNGETDVCMQIIQGATNPQTTPGNYGNRNWQKGTVVFSRTPTIAARQYGAVAPNALILGWVCTAAGAPGTWQEIAIMLPY